MQGGLHRLQITAAVILAATLVLGLGIRWYQLRQPLPRVDPVLTQRFQAIADSLNALSSLETNVLRAQRAQSQQWDRININEANQEELMRLPGIGKTLARRILTARKNRGPFQQPEDLLQVPGIGEKKLSRIRPLITLKDEARNR